MPTKLSININKYALLRNSRGHDSPSLAWAVREVIHAGAHGITVHPRMDQRHVRFADVPLIAEQLRREFPGIEYNIECEADPFLIDLVLEVGPHQCTLVPVTPGEVTSDHGWDPAADRPTLGPVVKRLRNAGIRVSCFADCAPQNMASFHDLGVHRVELYTGPYAWAWGTPNQDVERARFWDTAAAAASCGLGLNAGHDLDRHNLAGLRGCAPLLEVSIGHASICRALEVGTTTAVQELLEALDDRR
jgi:pyridoxine 5-phosphate synthase